ncbi:MAG: hypothetical protein PHD48_11130 [Alphaproteobacteria bacterium]|nr:hypothetical protein [Alphaproteobacteria bacterium]
MSSTDKLKIAIAADFRHTLPDFGYPDDTWLQQELEDRGHTVHIINWKLGAMAFVDYDVVYVSSTWDIPEHPQDFMRWLADCEADGTRRFINDAHVIRNNIVKSIYLSKLKEAFGEEGSVSGSIVPSRFYAINANPADSIEGLGSHSLEDILNDLDKGLSWKEHDIVIKPIISADGMDTCVYKRTPVERKVDPSHILDNEKASEHFLRLASTCGVILQPYITGIENGEYSLVFFDGNFSHGIRKQPGFKNGSNSRTPIYAEGLPQGMIDFASRAVQFMENLHGPGSITRARVDLFEGKCGAMLSELECAEPATNIQYLEQAEQSRVIQRYANAIENRAYELRAEMKV